ncbi:MAG: 3-deoxy-7-phosphoheptulonate synthase, partial [Chloroflexota bacterium]
MKSRATQEQVSGVVKRIEALGYRAHLSQGEETTIIGVIGDDRPIDRTQFEVLDGVEKTVPILKPFKLASRDMRPADTLIPLNNLQVGGPQIVIIAGPCSVESRSQILEAAYAVKEAGATALRGGAFKPRPSPYSFQGMGEEGLALLADA